MFCDKSCAGKAEEYMSRKLIFIRRERAEIDDFLDKLYT